MLDLLLSRSSGAGLSILRLGISSGSKSIQPTNPGGPNATPKYVWDGDDDGQVWLARQAQANYLVQYTKFYAQEDIRINDVAFTNEPNWTTSYASMRFTPAQRSSSSRSSVRSRTTPD